MQADSATAPLFLQPDGFPRHDLRDRLKIWLCNASGRLIRIVLAGPFPHDTAPDTLDNHSRDIAPIYPIPNGTDRDRRAPLCGSSA
jgi:hypothetical protein